MKKQIILIILNHQLLLKGVEEEEVKKVEELGKVGKVGEVEEVGKVGEVEDKLKIKFIFNNSFNIFFHFVINTKFYFIQC